MSEINDTEEFPEDILPITLELIDQYQRTEPILLDKYTTGTHQMVFFVEEVI